MGNDSLGLYIEISGKLYELFVHLGSNTRFFNFKNSRVMYDPIRDGEPLAEEVAKEVYPEVFV